MEEQRYIEMTLDYYEQNANTFHNSTVGIDMSDMYECFLSRIPEGSSILDAGCGSGRDSKAFTDLGYNVSAFDASEQMVLRARRLTGLDIQVRQFEQMDENGVYDGVWCCASLLHVPLVEMLPVMRRVARSLKKNGAWFLSFKYGQGEREKDGRHFTDMNKERLTTLASKLEYISIVNIWLTQDKRPEREDLWLNAILLRH